MSTNPILNLIASDPNVSPALKRSIIPEFGMPPGPHSGGGRVIDQCVGPSPAPVPLPRYHVTEERGPIGGTIFYVRDRTAEGDEHEVADSFYAYRSSVQEMRTKAAARAAELNACPLEDE